MLFVKYDQKKNHVDEIECDYNRVQNDLAYYDKNFIMLQTEPNLPKSFAKFPNR